jgi:hypothetical protein
MVPIDACPIHRDTLYMSTPTEAEIPATDVRLPEGTIAAQLA